MLRPEGVEFSVHETSPRKEDSDIVQELPPLGCTKLVARPGVSAGDVDETLEVVSRFNLAQCNPPKDERKVRGIVEWTCSQELTNKLSEPDLLKGYDPEDVGNVQRLIAFLVIASAVAMHSTNGLCGTGGARRLTMRTRRVCRLTR